MEERRDSFRLKVNGLEIHIQKPFIAANARVLDISASGVALILPAGYNGILQNRTLRLGFLNDGDFRTRGELVRSVEEENVTKYGIRFRNMRLDQRQTLCQFLIQRFIDAEQDDPAQENHKLKIAKRNADDIRKLIHYHCIISGRHLYMRGEGNSPPRQFKVEGISEKGGQSFLTIKAASSDHDFLEEGMICNFSFPGSTALNYFVTEIGGKTAETVSIAVPSEMYQYGFRDSDRRSPQHNHPEKIHITHPERPKTVLSKTILDFGAQGFSFLLEPKADCLFPGERISNICLHLPEGQVELGGVIRNVRKKGKGFHCGFEIRRFKNDSQELLWKKYVLESTYGRLRIAGTDDASNVWAVLESSKYADDVAPHLRGRLKRHFFKTWKKHAENPRAFVSMILSEKDKPVATFAANLLYPRTCLGHHFSIDQTTLKNLFDIGSELCRGLIFALQHLLSSEYFICYVDAFKNLPKLLYGRFLNTYPAPGDFIYDRHHLYKGWPENNGGCNQIRRGSIKIEPVRGETLDQLVSFFNQNISELELKAFSYEKDNLTLEHFSRACHESGYERTREIFFAVENGTPLAALIAESGDEAMNLFSLLNCCRIVFLKPEAKEDDRIYEILLQQAMRYYLDRNKPEFVFLMEYDGARKRSFERVGLEYTTDVMRWLGRTEMLKAHLNYVEEILGIRHHRLHLR